MRGISTTQRVINMENAIYILAGAILEHNEKGQLSPKTISLLDQIVSDEDQKNKYIEGV